jgi:hypothetical protein
MRKGEEGSGKREVGRGERGEEREEVREKEKRGVKINAT